MDGKGKDVRWQQPHLALTDLLSAEPGDKVIVAIGAWVEKRRMKFRDEEDVKFEQRREADGDWMVTEFIEPTVDNWYWVAKNAHDAQLAIPEIAWLGPVERIPADLLLSDLPLNVRRVDKAGWLNLRAVAQESCEGEA